jgi:trigger factor
MVAEVARGKALATVLAKAKVTDSNGKAVDLTEFTAAATAEGGDFIEADAGHDAHDGHDHDGDDH